ncbi:MAG: hypothetical protein AVW05_04380 [Hadesarchaea archaeon DG-33]|nr:MAG: hypothetical protein AVW05_04380 [Hadesarchaea archaeon DG-33]
MSERRPEKIDFLGIASFGFFLALTGVIFAVTPELPSKIYDFFKDFQLQLVYPGVYFYAPASNHPILYNVAFQFCLIFAIFQVVILVARFILKESISRKAGTFSGLFFWFGSVAALSLLKSESVDWFIFLGWLIVLVGIVITVRSSISLAFWPRIKSSKRR